MLLEKPKKTPLFWRAEIQFPWKGVGGDRVIVLRREIKRQFYFRVPALRF
jgi:hypothetical protein